ncbi:MAG: hypothetical protein VYE68_11890 [Acidobacteriota bacterium]|nr:hypothetical protein [Acidobacteriota bacterium]
MLAMIGCLAAATSAAQPDIPAALLRAELTPLAQQVQETLGVDAERFRATLDELASEEARGRLLLGDVGFSLSGNESGDSTGFDPGNDTLFRLRSSATLRQGQFPSRIEFLADVNALIRNNVVEQDFSRFRIGYDYQHTDHLGGFAYFERYADDFMSVASRYEIGAGVSMGVGFGPGSFRRSTAATLAHLTSDEPGGFRCGITRLQTRYHPSSTEPLTGCPPPTPGSVSTTPDGPRPTAATFDSLRSALPHLRRALHARQSMFFLALGVGVFSEFEHAIIETRVSEFDPIAFKSPPPDAPPAPDEPIVPITELPHHIRELPRRSVTLPGTQRYRLLLWPTIRVHPISALTVNFNPSFKLPISSPRRFVDGELAYRMDWFVRIDWRLSDDTQRVNLFVKFDYFKNMGPPIMSEELIAEAALERLVYHRTGASKKHRIVSMGVSIGLDP